MPKIFVLRHQLAEQQARLKQQQAKGQVVEADNATVGGLNHHSLNQHHEVSPPPQPQPLPPQPPQHREINNAPLDFTRLNPARSGKKIHSIRFFNSIA